MKATKIYATMAVFVMALALSCTDHSNPDPGGPNCSRVDGTPRLYPCEFEIVKIDFMQQSSNDATFATITPANHNVALKAALAFSYVKNSTLTATVVFKIRLHIKRIASPAFPTPGGYWISESVAGGEVDDPSVLRPNTYYPAPALGMAVGETIQVFSRLTFYTSDNVIDQGPTMISIQNPVTYANLAAAPNNYALVRDLSEAHYVGFNTTYTGL
jgi:hypothetical protein